MPNSQRPDRYAGSPLLLRPRTSRLVEGLLSDEALARQILHVCGSPLNVLLPQAITPNLTAFQEVLSKHRLASRIFFAHKVNQSHSVLAEMALTTLGVDVASVAELSHALSCGFTGQRLEATGPKNTELLYLCLMHGVLVNVDNMHELNDIIAVKQKLGLREKVRVLMRLCGFSAPHMQVLARQSRFGIPVTEATDALLKIVEHKDDLELLGFSFHLDSSSLDERVVAIQNCLQMIEQAVEMGLEPRVINIGGHFRINYLAHQEDWLGYMSAINEAALGIGPQVTWQNNYFGLYAQGGTLRGKFNSYGYYEPTSGASFLDKILESELPGYGNQKVASFLRENMIELWLEPGRAMLDQAGVTFAEVNSVKMSSHGDTLVMLNMKRSDIAYLDQEVFVDPILVTGQQVMQGDYVPVYFAGSLCLESDLIYRHLTYLPRLPKPGDILAFVNTAAYMMDFSASPSIMQPLAMRVAVVEEGGNYLWTIDDRYAPVRTINRKE